MTDLTFTIPPEYLEAIAQRAAELVLEQLAGVSASTRRGSPWLYGQEAAAEYLSWTLDRVKKLTAAGQMPHHRLEGEQRVSYRTDELDAWLDNHYEGPPHLRAVS